MSVWSPTTVAEIYYTYVCGGNTGGHVPGLISAAYSLFLQRLGGIS